MITLIHILGDIVISMGLVLLKVLRMSFAHPLIGHALREKSIIAKDPFNSLSKYLVN